MPQAHTRGVEFVFSEPPEEMSVTVFIHSPGTGGRGGIEAPLDPSIQSRQWWVNPSREPLCQMQVEGDRRRGEMSLLSCSENPSFRALLTHGRAPAPDWMEQMFLRESGIPSGPWLVWGFQITHEASAPSSSPDTNFPGHRKYGCPFLKSDFPSASFSLASRHSTQPG